MTVPFLDNNRSRYNILGINPTWVYHRGTLDGTPPNNGAGVDLTDPDIVVGGRCEFTGLTAGGLFTLLGNYGRPLVIEDVDIGGGAVSLVRADPDNPGTPIVVNTDISSNLAALPFTVPAKHYLKVVGGTHAGFLCRIKDGAEKAF